MDHSRFVLAASFFTLLGHDAVRFAFITKSTGTISNSTIDESQGAALFGKLWPLVLISLLAACGEDGNINFSQPSGTVAKDFDLSLTDVSPLLNMGDPSILDPDGSRSDIGAYGGPNAWE